MRLADFIDTHVEAIVDAAEAFASTLLPAAAHLDSAALRDHMPLILQAVAKDLRTTQTAQEALDKSLGRVFASSPAAETAAQTHALLRAKGGFQIGQLVSEYRALRASVLRLWVAAGIPLDEAAIGDMIRFNEAIDQAVSESVAFFAAEVDRWRHVFLGVLGHDLRSPLNAILLTSQLLEKLSVEAPVTRQVHRLIRGGERMSRLLDDLLDFSRASLGQGIAIRRTVVDLAQACAEEVDLLTAALPGREISLQVKGTVVGSFDASRVREALGNLVINAAKYGAEGSVIRVVLAEVHDGVEVSVENDGDPISPENLALMFEPLRRGSHPSLSDRTERASLGLGLFIVREIARAHGGEVAASTTDTTTRFTVAFPHSHDTAAIPA